MLKLMTNKQVIILLIEGESSASKVLKVAGFLTDSVEANDYNLDFSGA
jgi:hypothetical protein